jgi:hypothetical protein
MMIGARTGWVVDEDKDEGGGIRIVLAVLVMTPLLVLLSFIFEGRLCAVQVSPLLPGLASFKSSMIRRASSSGLPRVMITLMRPVNGRNFAGMLSHVFRPITTVLKVRLVV